MTNHHTTTKESEMPADFTTVMVQTFKAMDTIGTIVNWYMDPTNWPEGATEADALKALGEDLADWAVDNDHSKWWVLKKAHDAVRNYTWERFNIPLNRAMGASDDYIG